MEDKESVIARKVVELKEVLALLRLQLALRSINSGFNPNQPRWPSGNSWGGRWRDVGSVTLVAGKLDQLREPKCQAQYERDLELCSMSRSPLCWSSAMDRRAACIAGDIIPTLRH
jgi:hypothetical protein